MCTPICVGKGKMKTSDRKIGAKFASHILDSLDLETLLILCENSLIVMQASPAGRLSPGILCTCMLRQILWHFTLLVCISAGSVGVAGSVPKCVPKLESDHSLCFSKGVARAKSPNRGDSFACL